MRWKELFEGKTYDLNGLTVWFDPSRQQLTSLVNQKPMRAIVAPNLFVIWSAYEELHAYVLKDLIKHGFLTPEEKSKCDCITFFKEGSDVRNELGDPKTVNGMIVMTLGHLPNTPAFLRAVRPPPTIAEAAKTVRVYHGTDADFGKFSDQFRGSSHGNTPTNKAGFHFSDSPEVAKTFGHNLLQCEVTFQNPYTVDAKGKSYSDMKHRINDILDRIDRSKYDGIILKNYLDAGKHGGDYLKSNHYIPFTSRQIKVLPNDVEESFMDKVGAKIKAKTTPDRVTSQRGRSMPGSNPERKLTRRKRFV